jgi:serine/threonine protein kinase/WD40 repeat protein
MSLAAGTRLGGYEIVHLLGAGAMGEVYRARDAKLRRDVALKILPQLLAADPDRRARFTRESHVLASLNHPNIAGIHGIEEEDGVTALVLELVDGQTIAEQIASGPIPVDEALTIAAQIADALDAAHEKGIVHRDLKPANIKIAKDGRVKVLDFGLAKALTDDVTPGFSPAETSPTMTAVASGLGVIVGTAAYMSPEQAKGKPVDKRADIWAFGCVVFEMLTGQRAFDGEGVADFVVAVMTKEPAWALLPPPTPPRVVELLTRCLKKDPRDRLRDIGDARMELDAVASSSGWPLSGQAGAKRRLLPWMVSAALMTALLAGAAIYYPATPPRTSDLITLQLLPPPQTRFESLEVAPDGRNIAVVAVNQSGNSQLWLRALDAPTARLLPETEGASFPFWSPDSRVIGFFAAGKLKRIDVAGGRPRTVCAVLPGRGEARGGTWNRDGVILYAVNPFSQRPLYRVSAEGGSPVPATTLDPARHDHHTWPKFLSDGRHFLFFNSSNDPKQTGIYLGSLDSGRTARLLTAETNGVIAAQSATDPPELLFVREGTLMATTLDVPGLRVQGAGVPIADHVGVDLYSQRSTVSVSNTGVLTYDAGAANGFSQIQTFDRGGHSSGTVGAPGVNIDVRLAPDDRRLAVQREDGQGGADIWLIDLVRGVNSRVTHHASYSAAPVWSPDGSKVTFFSARDGSWNLYQTASSGAGDDTVLFKSEHNKVPDDWSPDGRFLLFQDLATGGDDLWLLPARDAAPASVPSVWLRTEFDEYWARFSPDGKWVVYQSNESGRMEIYVRPFRSDAQGATEKWQVSVDGGVEARWSRKSNEIFFLGLDSRLMTVQVESVPTFRAGLPRALFLTRAVGIGRYDVNSTGTTFFVNTPADEFRISPATIVLNWRQEPKRSVRENK